MHWWLIVLISLAGIVVGWVVMCSFGFLFMTLLVLPIACMFEGMNYWKEAGDVGTIVWRGLRAPFRPSWLRAVNKRFHLVFGRPA